MKDSQETEERWIEVLLQFDSKITFWQFC